MDELTFLHQIVGTKCENSTSNGDRAKEKDLISSLSVLTVGFAVAPTLPYSFTPGTARLCPGPYYSVTLGMPLWSAMLLAMLAAGILSAVVDLLPFKRLRTQLTQVNLEFSGILQ